ncbi:MAG: hypothetical protein RBU37_02445 [Myxococcota bacterium]|jgi:hypothetical protein|nr:hypothetical protein [Myxococcota bacterium]
MQTEDKRNEPETQALPLDELTPSLKLASPFVSGSDLVHRATWGDTLLLQCAVSGRYCVLLRHRDLASIHEYDEVVGRWCERCLASFPIPDHSS